MRTCTLRRSLGGSGPVDGQAWPGIASPVIERPLAAAANLQRRASLQRLTDICLGCARGCEHAGALGQLSRDGGGCCAAGAVRVLCVNARPRQHMHGVSVVQRILRGVACTEQSADNDAMIAQLI